MPFGPQVCGRCGATESIEAHLYSRNHGCPDDLRAWLCARGARAWNAASDEYPRRH
jgi:hypothetical protein